MIKMILTTGLACILLLGCAPCPKTVYFQGLQYYHEQHYKDAFEHFYYAAYYSYPAAEYATGYMYYNGIGIRKNINQGIRWIAKAAQHKNADAIKALRNLTHAAYPF